MSEPNSKDPRAVPVVPNFIEHSLNVQCPSSVAVAILKRQARHALLPSVQQIRRDVFIVCEWHCVFIQARETVRIGLEVGPLVVRERHGEKRLRIAHKLVHVPLTGHLKKVNVNFISNLLK